MRLSTGHRARRLPLYGNKSECEKILLISSNFISSAALSKDEAPRNDSLSVLVRAFHGIGRLIRVSLITDYAI